MTQPSPMEASVVAAYESHARAEQAITALQAAGVDMKCLSIVGKDFHSEERVVGFYSSGDRMQFWGGRGALWGGLWGVLFGGAFLVVPGLGPLVAMGPIAGWLVGVLEGAAVGGTAGVLAAALSSVGIPEDSVLKYELQVKAGKFLVIARGTEETVERARAVLGGTGATLLAEHRALVTRKSILGLLSDEEVTRVSTAEGTARLAAGDEYVDLEQPTLGVLRAQAAPTPMGHVLPRKSVQAQTWGRILTHLSAPAIAASSAAPRA
jgi:hypothetical protein